MVRYMRSHTPNSEGVAPNSTPSFVRSFIAQVALLTGALVAVFVAGGPREAGMGIFLFLAGLVCFLISPATKVPWSLWLAGGLLVAALSSTLLPVDWVGLPAWSSNLRDIQGLLLPDCIAADRLLAGFWVLLLVFSVFIGLYSLSSPLGTRQMADIAHVAVIGCSLYAVLGWCVWQGGWNYPFYEKPTFTQAAFGFFPNRNHTAGFLLTGVILSMGLIHYEMTRGTLLRGIIAAVGFALLVSVLLFFSVSRAGLLFLFLGVLIWVLGLGKYRSKALLMGGGGMFVVIMVFFLLSGSGLLQRLKGTGSNESSPRPAIQSLAEDPRASIAKDTLPMIIDHPVTGIGLGSYSMVYPFYADKSLRDRTTALHPESDWLMLCSEGGIPSVVIVLAALGLLFMRIPRLKSYGGNWSLRWTFLTAFIIELLHGLVDVPLHRQELGWWVMLLGGIGFGSKGSLEAARGISFGIQRLLFVIAGIVMIGFGVLLIGAQFGMAPAMPPFAVKKIQRHVLETFGDGTSPDGVRGAIEELRKTILLHPMAHQLYYQLAVLMIAEEDRVDHAKELFTVQRALSPIDPDLPYEQGKTLIRLDPEGTAEYWNEALRRQLALDLSPNSPIPRTEQLFGSMLHESEISRELFYRMQDLASLAPGLRLMWLSNLHTDHESIATAISDKDFMESLSMKQQGRLIELWWARGDHNAVAAFLESHPEYARAAVATKAAQFAASAQEEQACRLLIENFSIPIPEQPIANSVVRSAGRDIPDEPLDAAKYYMERGNEAAALRLFGEAMKGSTRTEALRLRASMEMRVGNWKAAFADLLGYLHERGEL